MGFSFCVGMCVCVLILQLRPVKSTSFTNCKLFFGFSFRCSFQLFYVYGWHIHACDRFDITVLLCRCDGLTWLLTMQKYAHVRLRGAFDVSHKVSLTFYSTYLDLITFNACCLMMCYNNAVKGTFSRLSLSFSLPGEMHVPFYGIVSGSWFYCMVMLNVQCADELHGYSRAFVALKTRHFALCIRINFDFAFFNGWKFSYILFAFTQTL